VSRNGGLGEVVDFHVRLPPRPGAGEALLAGMDRLGIAASVVVAGGLVRSEVLSRHLREGGFVRGEVDNASVLSLAETTGGRLLPCWFGNPHGGLDAYRTSGSSYVGLELSPAVHGVRLDCPEVADFIEAASELGHWVYVVCINRPGCDVPTLAAVAARHPEVTFVLGHLGYGNIDFHGLGLVVGHPNVVVETSGGYSTVLAFAIEELGSDRVLFGSEHPLQDPRVELTKVDVLELPPAQRAAVLGGNARRLLKEET
jgi:hypothetical protein